MDELHTIFYVRLHYLFKLQKNNSDIYRVITKKTPQLISFLFEIQRAVHQIKGFKKYYKLDIKCCPNNSNFDFDSPDVF
jgi:hypothetical protein